MFRKYGAIGLLLVILTELNLIFKIEPFYTWTFPIIWISFIFFLDAVNYKIRGSSLIMNRPYTVGGMFIISAMLWWAFEFVNIFILSNWAYSGLERLGIYANIFGTISFSTVVPAMFELSELIKSVHLFDNKKLKKNHAITKRFLRTMIIAGIICFILPFIIPEYTFPLVWISLFLILDPINYINRSPSIIKHLHEKDLATPLSVLLAGIIMGFLWEFWNYWAPVKWTYTIPYFDFIRIFEMPLLGYLGYFGFAFEIYAIYWFVTGMLSKREKYLR